MAVFEGRFPQITFAFDAAFSLSSREHSDLHHRWIKISARIGGELPGSMLMASVQRVGRIDMLLRSLEDEAQIDVPFEQMPSRHDNQTMMSEIWVGWAYEVFRLLIQRGRALSEEPGFKLLAHHLTLLRMTIDKHEIAADRKLVEPLQMMRHPPNGDASDIYEYSRNDPLRAHIMPVGLSGRGSVMWNAMDIKAGRAFWLERRELSDRILALWAPPV